MCVSVYIYLDCVGECMRVLCVREYVHCLWYFCVFVSTQTTSRHNMSHWYVDGQQHTHAQSSFDTWIGRRQFDK